MSTEKKELIKSRAPTRIDLAGGTVDIWPIYLLVNRATTVNLGIDLFAEAELEHGPASSGQGKITLRSKDQGHELTLGWNELSKATAPPALELHLKLLRHFAFEKKHSGGDLVLSTRAKSPAGAGLGGSSTLSIAMIGALAKWSRGAIDVERDGEQLIKIARDTETTVIQVPAGMQDYYGAMFGGLQSLRWSAGQHQREKQSADLLRELDNRLLVFYSGQSRNSGINNWALFKAFIDREGKVREQFDSIVAATLRLEDALRARDWRAVGEAIASEWEVRRTLAPGITTPEIDSAFSIAKEQGATAGKICGAGGGGCLFVYLPSDDPELRQRVQDRMGAISGVRHLPCQSSPHGLEVTTEKPPQ